MTAAQHALRDATAADFPAILALNEASVHFLSPLTPARLSELHREAAVRVVVEQSGRVAAFMLAFREGADYDSINYRWFADRYPRFLYVDRVVVGEALRGQGVGGRLYRHVFTQARLAEVPQVTCEFDVDPPNAISERFHARFGFREVGRQPVAGGAKVVSLQIAPVGDGAAPAADPDAASNLGAANE